jgi:hypothetical protein
MNMVGIFRSYQIQIRHFIISKNSISGAIEQLASKKAKSGILPQFLSKSGIEPENPNPLNE